MWPHTAVIGWKGPSVSADWWTSRLTTSHCAPSRCWLITYMQNRLVHHLISTKLHCASPKCMSVWNYHWMVIPRVRALAHHGAQCRSMVHNVALYRWNGAQNRLNKPKPACAVQQWEPDVLHQLHTFHIIISQYNVRNISTPVWHF